MDITINQPAVTPPPQRSTDAVALTVRNLSVFFGRNHALKNVSLDIDAKAVTAIIGPSGCGKSTFLRALNRMHELNPEARIEGEIRLFGDDIYSRNVEPVVVRRRVGMVFQKSNPFPTMSITENVTVGLRLNGIGSRKLLAERTEQSLRMAALVGRSQRPPACAGHQPVRSDSNSGSASRARWPCNRKCCSWMNRRPRSTRWPRRRLRI